MTRVRYWINISVRNVVKEYVKLLNLRCFRRQSSAYV
jgi:hypothetical protein